MPDKMVSNQCADNVDHQPWLNISREVPRIVDAGVLSSSDGECSPSVDAKLEPPSPPPSDAGIQLRCDRDFTDGEAMAQEHLMSSEGEISPSEAIELSPHLEQHRSMVDIPWWSSGEYRKVCVGGNTEHIYVRRDQAVWCG